MDVVPDVNWMLTRSVLANGEDGVGAVVSESRFIDDHGVVARNVVGSIRPAELSTKMIFFREGIASDDRADVERSGTKPWRSETLDRGGL